MPLQKKERCTHNFHPGRCQLINLQKGHKGGAQLCWASHTFLWRTASKISFWNQSFHYGKFVRFNIQPSQNRESSETLYRRLRIVCNGKMCRAGYIYSAGNTVNDKSFEGENFAVCWVHQVCGEKFCDFYHHHLHTSLKFQRSKSLAGKISRLNKNPRKFSHRETFIVYGI